MLITRSWQPNSSHPAPLPLLFGGGARQCVVCGLVLGLAIFLAAPTQACMHSEPPPPVCGKSLLISTAVPHVVLLPSGGTFDVSTLIFFTLVDFPAGSGICPGGPYSVDVEITVSCTPTADGGGTLVGAPLTEGFNQLVVPVTIPPGPPRLCTIAARATVGLADGMTLTAGSDAVVCLAEPAPENAALPRLDFELLGDVGSEISRVHPGDQSSFVYRVTNNDPLESFSGVLSADSLNTSRLPGATGPMPAGTGVFSISDPVQGDNFPLAFEDQLFEGCVPLPENPAQPAVPMLQEPVDLDAGESVDIEIFSRSWGMCADGSCNRSNVIVDGLFSDKSSGLACAGFITAAETAVPPTFEWPDSGEVAKATSPAPDRITLTGKPKPDEERRIDISPLITQLVVDGRLSPVTANPSSGAVFPELGRTQLQFLPKQPFQVDSIFDVFIDIAVEPGPGLDGQVRNFSVNLDAPTGFETQAPAGRGLIELAPTGFAIDSFFDITYQIEGFGIDNVGERRPLQWGDISMTRSPNGNGIRIQLQGGLVGPGIGNSLLAVEFLQDFRGFTSPNPQGLLGLVFADGFESGNVTSWSASSP